MAGRIAQARAEARARQGDRPALTDESIKDAVGEFRFRISSRAEQEEARGAAEAKWGRVADWDVSGVTSMQGLFEGAREFSEDLGLWDVSACESMSCMFMSAAAFDGDLASWDVSACEDMEDMFCAARAFGGDVAGWDVSACENMKNMFWNATAFDAAKHAPWYKP